MAKKEGRSNRKSATSGPQHSPMKKGKTKEKKGAEEGGNRWEA